MIDIERAESFSPFRVWARGGQAPLRAQAIFLPDRVRRGAPRRVRLCHSHQPKSRISLPSAFPCRPGGAAEGQGDLQGGARAGRAVQGDPATERLDPVFEPGQARTAAEVRAAAST
jgi:hypothetical protein